MFLTAENNPVHIAAPNPDNWRAAGLTLQRREAKRFLNAGVNEQIRRPIKPRQLLRVGAILPPDHRPGAFLQSAQLPALQAVAHDQEMIALRVTRGKQLRRR